MAGKWYNNHELSVGVGVGLAVLFSGIGMGGCEYLKGRVELEKSRAEAIQLIQERDLNRNGKSERYIEFNGEKYFSTIDGKNLEESLK